MSPSSAEGVHRPLAGRFTGRGGVWRWARLGCVFWMGVVAGPRPSRLRGSGLTCCMKAELTPGMGRLEGAMGR